MNRLDATELAQRVKKGEVTPKELVAQAIERIKSENKRLNAVVHERFDEALREAETGDFKDKPFGGVPILIKDLGQSLQGFVTTSGSKLLTESIAKETDHYVQRFLDAGFIILGSTNVPEFGFKNVTDSALYGHAHNHFDPDRTSGGSSGGSAAAIAANLVSVTGASDGGGSIRIPASYNGLIGLKPSRGRIVVGPGSMRGWGGASVSFVLANSVRDTKQLLYVLEGNQEEAPYNISPLLPTEEWPELDFKKLRVAYSTVSPIGSEVSSDAVEAVQKAASYLKEKGACVEEAMPLYDGIELMHAYYMMNGAETAAMMANIETNFGRELTRDDMETMTWAIYQYGKKLSAVDYIEAFSIWDQVAEVMTDFHQTYDVFLQPTTAEVAPLLATKFQTDDMMAALAEIDETTSVETAKQLIYDMFAHSLAVTPFTQLANLTGQPAISLPTYRNADDLPLGTQLMALKGKEPLLLQIAEKMEAEDFFIY